MEIHKPNNRLTIVTGHPRSGTSMMMQILHAGGFTVLTDDVRVANADNPRGYFEHEAVKNLASDTGWLHTAQGKVIKVVLFYLRYLPNTLNYNVIFMRRPVEEVLASQAIMLARAGDSIPVEANLSLKALFLREEQQARTLLSTLPNVSVFDAEYHSFLQDTVSMCDELNIFLGGHIATHSMAAVIEPGLCHQSLD